MHACYYPSLFYLKLLSYYRNVDCDRMSLEILVISYIKWLVACLMVSMERFVSFCIGVNCTVLMIVLTSISVWLYHWSGVQGRDSAPFSHCTVIFFITWSCDTLRNPRLFSILLFIRHHRNIVSTLQIILCSSINSLTILYRLYAILAYVWCETHTWMESICPGSFSDADLLLRSRN